MSSWLVYSFFTLALWGLWGVLNKVATGQLPVRLVYVIEVIGNIVVAGIIVAAMRPRGLWEPVGIIAALGAGTCGALGLLCFLRALASGRAAVVVPLTALYPVITVLLCVLLLHESLTWRQMGGIALALVAGWLLAE